MLPTRALQKAQDHPQTAVRSDSRRPEPHVRRLRTARQRWVSSSIVDGLLITMVVAKFGGSGQAALFRLNSRMASETVSVQRLGCGYRQVYANDIRSMRQWFRCGRGRRRVAHNRSFDRLS
jgi:hypothetical protein